MLVFSARHEAIHLTTCVCLRLLISNTTRHAFVIHCVRWCFFNIWSTSQQSHKAKVCMKELRDTCTTHLKSADGSRLETQIGLEVLGDFSNKPLERQLADEKLGRLLITTDFTQSDGTRTITMRLLYSTSRRSTLSGCLRGKLFSRGLASGRLTGGLLRSRHSYWSWSTTTRTILPTIKILHWRSVSNWGFYCTWTSRSSIKYVTITWPLIGQIFPVRWLVEFFVKSCADWLVVENPKFALLIRIERQAFFRVASRALHSRSHNQGSRSSAGSALLAWEVAKLSEIAVVRAAKFRHVHVQKSWDVSVDGTWLRRTAVSDGWPPRALAKSAGSLRLKEARSRFCCDMMWSWPWKERHSHLYALLMWFRLPAYASVLPACVVPSPTAGAEKECSRRAVGWSAERFHPCHDQ